VLDTNQDIADGYKTSLAFGVGFAASTIQIKPDVEILGHAV
jgi:hypothetical protein